MWVPASPHPFAGRGEIPACPGHSPPRVAALPPVPAPPALLCPRPAPAPEPRPCLRLAARGQQKPGFALRLPRARCGPRTIGERVGVRLRSRSLDNGPAPPALARADAGSSLPGSGSGRHTCWTEERVTSAHCHVGRSAEPGEEMGARPGGPEGEAPGEPRPCSAQPALRGHGGTGRGYGGLGPIPWRSGTAHPCLPVSWAPRPWFTHR